ncbi:hypothetical protein CEQ30_40685 [Nocardia brasiliensis]|nr:hypothetical protein CEQ30_40685 [Nocardia brasiliensis]
MVHHSDRGSTYTAIRFANRLADNGIAQSMGSVGDSYDNALMENFFSTSKTELVYRNSWHTRERCGERTVLLHRRLVQHPTHPEEAALAITRRIRSQLPSPRSGRNQIIRSPAQRGTSCTHDALCMSSNSPTAEPPTRPTQFLHTW